MRCCLMLGSTGTFVICGALSAISSSVYAQDSSRELPKITIEASKPVRAKPAGAKSGLRAASARRPRLAAPPAPAVTAARAEPATAGAARHGLNQAPSRQTATTVARSQFDDRPSFSAGDILRESPGIPLKQGNGPRDVGISIRGPNTRNGLGIRNLVIFEDGFPVTQPDGLSRSDLIDPHADGGVDVTRGPSSALYGNYATGGALNFRTRPGGSIDRVEYGVDGGSFGYVNNYLAAGKKIRDFEASLFSSDVRGDGFTQNSWYNTKTEEQAMKRSRARVAASQLLGVLPVQSVVCSGRGGDRPLNFQDESSWT
jgi:iron complex outermembrane receptor protein